MDSGVGDQWVGICCSGWELSPAVDNRRTLALIPEDPPLETAAADAAGGIPEEAWAPMGWLLARALIFEDGDFVFPGTSPDSVRLTIKARIAPNHLISSSSLGAHSSRVRLVVTILKVCVPLLSSSASPNCGGDVTDGVVGTWRWAWEGKLYSKASSMSLKGNWRWGFVS